jgi:transposase
VLRDMSPRFALMYARTGRPSIPPEKLLRAQLLQILYTIRSERLLMEQLDYNLLFRWFVGLGLDDAVWDATVFTKNRERLLAGDVARAFLEYVVAEARAQHLLSSEHFSFDGTLIEAWASLKSFPTPPTNCTGTETRTPIHARSRPHCSGRASPTRFVSSSSASGTPSVPFGFPWIFRAST